MSSTVTSPSIPHDTRQPNVNLTSTLPMEKTAKAISALVLFVIIPALSLVFISFPISLAIAAVSITVGALVTIPGCCKEILKANPNANFSSPPLLHQARTTPLRYAPIPLRAQHPNLAPVFSYRSSPSYRRSPNSPFHYTAPHVAVGSRIADLSVNADNPVAVGQRREEPPIPPQSLTHAPYSPPQYVTPQQTVGSRIGDLPVNADNHVAIGQRREETPIPPPSLTRAPYSPPRYVTPQQTERSFGYHLFNDDHPRYAVQEHVAVGSRRRLINEEL